MPGNAPVAYEHYMARGHANQLRLLMQPDELPDNLDYPVLWQCLVTGSIESRAYHALPKRAGEKGPDGKPQYGSHGQFYWANYRQDYYVLAEKLGIEFVYDETHDYAPSSTRSDVKWRNALGQIFVVSIHKLKHGKMPKYLKQMIEGVRADA